MENKESPHLTAAEEVLLAAAKIHKDGKREFTEWDLTVETWNLDKQRWGLKGYEMLFPDHKRVMNEIMSKGTQKVIGKGWLKRTKQNYYQVTSSGLAKADSLVSSTITPRVRNVNQYDSIAGYISHQVFETHCKDVTEPKTWLGVAAFLGITKNDPDLLDQRLSAVKNVIQQVLKWMSDNDESVLRRSDSTKPITRDQVIKLREFISIIELRFKPQLDAIRKKRE